MSETYDYSSFEVNPPLKRRTTRAEYREYRRPSNYGIERIVNSLGKLSLDPEEYTLIGGANLVLRKIKPVTEDIDMLVSQAAFETLKVRSDATVVLPPSAAVERGATNKTIHLTSRRLVPTSAFTFLSGNGYYPMYFEPVRETSDILNGIPLASIDEVIASKQALHRSKDIFDLGEIAAHLDINIDIPKEEGPDDPEY